MRKVIERGEVRIVATPVKARKKVVLSVEGARFPRIVVPCTFGTELEAAYNGYVKLLVGRGFKVDSKKPNLYSAFFASRPVRPVVDLLPGAVVVVKKHREPPPPPKPVEVEFETNLVEALEGWKSWDFNEPNLVTSRGMLWRPLEAVEAECKTNCTKIPAEHHSCGIYAADECHVVSGYSEVLGKVYGWGRYIRGESGWRSQFAYPKCFFLKQRQKELVEPLKAFGVPIYLSQPMQVFFPEEGGFYEYRQDTPDGDGGTDEVTRAYEDYDEDDD